MVSAGHRGPALSRAGGSLPPVDGTEADGRSANGQPYRPGPGRGSGILAVTRDAFHGRLPERYADYPASFRAPFDHAVGKVIGPGQRILDVGGGRTATVAPDQRPPGCSCVGFDVLASELEAAPAGSYDELVVGDITRRRPELAGAFDLIVSFQVLEHVDGLERALAHMVEYLRPGGHLVAQFSGSFASYSLISRAVPHAVARRVQRRLYGREPDTVFPAHYDGCYAAALRRMIPAGVSADIEPLWIAAPYFRFSRALQSAYIAYEEWARRGDRVNLAPYYLLTVRA